MPTQVTTKTVEERDDEIEVEDLQPTPMFDRTSDKKSKAIAKIWVKRTDPNDGYLGDLQPDATEKDISSKWGGGEYKLQGKNAAGQVVHTQTVKIAGDPTFSSEIDEARWRRANGLKNAASNPDGGAGVRDVLALLEEREEKRRDEERERREQERQDARAYTEKMARDQADRDERRRKDEQEREDRRRAEAREDEERRTRLHREDLDRADAANKAQLAQTQQFFTQLQAISKREERAAGDADPIKLFTMGMEIATKMQGGGGGGGEPTDALTALFSRLPETLAEVRTTAKEAYSEVRKNPATAAPAPTGDEITITGPVATQFKQMIAALQARGKDPERVIGEIAGRVTRMSRVPKTVAPVPAAAATKKKKAPARRPPAKGKRARA